MVARQGRHELIGFRQLVAGDALLHPGAQGGFVDAGAGAGFDDGVDGLAEFVVRDADHSGIGDVGVFGEGGLDLGRVDVGPAADDEVDAAVREEQVCPLYPSDAAHE